MRRHLSEAEQREIEARRHELPAGPVDDAENPAWTAEDFARAKRPADLPEAERDALLAAFPKTKLGRPKKAAAKRVVTLRLHPDLIAALQEEGEGWRARIEAILTASVERKRGKAAMSALRSRVAEKRAETTKTAEPAATGFTPRADTYPSWLRPTPKGSKAKP